MRSSVMERAILSLRSKKPMPSTTARSNRRNAQRKTNLITYVLYQGRKRDSSIDHTLFEEENPIAVGRGLQGHGRSFSHAAFESSLASARVEPDHAQFGRRELGEIKS